MRQPNTSHGARCATGRNQLRAFALLSAALFVFSSSQLRAQSAPDDWEKAAGGEMAFDAASVKQSESGLPQPDGRNMPNSNIPMNDRDNRLSTGGFFSATNMPLSSYIGFAYKLPFTQIGPLSSQLPNWAIQDRFDIEARAQGNPTKDQMRLMLQALLADRFKLAVHFETRQIPVYELALIKPNALGPQLRPHPNDPPCPASGPSGSHIGPAGAVTGGFPSHCGAFMPMEPTAPGRQRMGARNLPWYQFANSVGLMGRVADRPVLDDTGLSGNIDFVLEWTPAAPATPDFQPDLSGPTFPEALQDQLGLKLIPERAPVQILVIDHIEQPSPN